MLADASSKQKLRQKSQQKKESWRGFGEPASAQLQETNAAIYNDFDLYQSLLSDFLAQHENGGAVHE
jgi:hypothetical protein